MNVTEVGGVRRVGVLRVLVLPVGVCPVGAALNTHH